MRFAEVIPLRTLSITGGDNSLQIGGLCGYSLGIISNCYATGAVSGGNYSDILGGLCGGNGGSISDCYTSGTVSGGNGCENIGGLCGTSGGSISNCHSDSVITGGTHLYVVGGLCGRNGGIISDCYATGAVTGGDHSSAIAGLCGRNDSSIIDCYATSAVTGGSYSLYLGGLCGVSYDTITNCHATGDVTGEDDSVHIGSLCGSNLGGTISNCYATGAASGGGNLGGLCGDSNGIISGCYATGAVTGQISVGGLCGINGGSVSNCYAAGDVLGNSSVGGLCGRNPAGSINNCYSTGKVTGDSGTGGLFALSGYGNSGGGIVNCFWDREASSMNTSDGGMSKTTAQMKSAATYIGWNQGDWVIDDGIDYPHLAWEAGAVGLAAITTDYPARTYAGNGDDQPFELANSSDIVCMSLRIEDWDKNFVVTSDIDMAGVTDYYPPFNFSGKINGSDHIITNLVIDANVIGNRDQLGFIGQLNGGEIEGLGIENSSVIGVVNSNYLGGLCGNKLRGTISNCYATSTVTGGSTHLGGLCGNNDYGMISNSYASGAVSGGLGSAYLGGLCGSNNGNASISRCYATGAVSSGGSYRNCVGGLCGYNASSISDCYATGWVTGQNYLGGLCGENFHGGTIRNCYSTGRVFGGILDWPNRIYLGGLCGNNFRTISNCFWDKGTSYMYESAGGTGKTTAQMKTQSTFTNAGWDFVGEIGNGTDDIWRMCVDGIERPKLWWEFGTGNFACGNSVNFNSFTAFAASWSLSVGDTGYNDKFDLGDVNK